MVLLAKCTNCGQELQITPDDKRAICIHCVTPFVFERTAFNNEMSLEALIKNKAIEEKNEVLAYLREKKKVLGERKRILQSRVRRIKAICLACLIAALIAAVYYFARLLDEGGNVNLTITLVLAGAVILFSVPIVVVLNGRKIRNELLFYDNALTSCKEVEAEIKAERAEIIGG